MTNEYFGPELGKLWTNFTALDALIRVFLDRLPHTTKSGLPFGTDMRKSAVGTEFPESSIATYRSLRVLVKAFNQEVVKAKLGNPIDERLVDLRDALAHGFISTDEKEGPMRLLKFERSRPGYVRIARNEEMTEQWFDGRIGLTRIAIKTVCEAVDKLPPPKPRAKQS